MSKLIIIIVVLGYVILGFIFGFSGFGGLLVGLIVYFASNQKESNISKEMREAREADLKKKKSDL